MLDVLKAILIGGLVVLMGMLLIALLPILLYLAAIGAVAGIAYLIIKEGKKNKKAPE